MQQAKISFEEEQIQFINSHEEFGFKDKSSLVRSAVDELKKNLEKEKLTESARLYSENYKEDTELREWTNSAIEEWPL